MASSRRSFSRLGETGGPAQAVALEGGGEHAQALSRAIGGAAGGAVILEGGAGGLHVAEQRVHGERPQRRGGGVLLVVGEHAVGQAAEVGVRVQLDGLADAFRIEPAGLAGRLQGPGLGLFLVDLARRLGLLAVHGGGGEDNGVDRAVLGGGEGEGLDGVGFRVEAHVGRGIVDAGGVGGRVHVVGPHLLGAIGQARVGVDEEGQVRPVLHELLVVQVVRDVLVNPRQHERAVGAGAHGERHVGLGGLGGHVGVDDDGLHAEVRPGVGQPVAAVGRLGGVRLAAPQHEDALRVVAAGAVQLGVVGDAHPAIHVVHVNAAVEAHRGGGDEVARHGALAGAGGQRVAAAEGVVEAGGLPLDVGAAASAGAPVGVGAVLLHGRGDLLAGQVNGLVPADGLPLVLAALADALHGVQHVAGAVDGLNLGQALQAHAALVQGAVRVSFDLHDAAVLGVHAHRAAVGAAMAGGLVHHALHGSGGEGLIGRFEQRDRAGGRKGRARGRCGLHEAASADGSLGHGGPLFPLYGQNGVPSEVVAIPSFPSL